MNDVLSGIPMHNDTDNKTLGMNSLLTSKEERLATYRTRDINPW